MLCQWAVLGYSLFTPFLKYMSPASLSLGTFLVRKKRSKKD